MKYTSHASFFDHIIIRETMDYVEALGVYSKHWFVLSLERINTTIMYMGVSLCTLCYPFSLPSSTTSSKIDRN